MTPEERKIAAKVMGNFKSKLRGSLAKRLQSPDDTSTATQQGVSADGIADDEHSDVSDMEKSAVPMGMAAEVDDGETEAINPGDTGEEDDDLEMLMRFRRGEE